MVENPFRKTASLAVLSRPWYPKSNRLYDKLPQIHSHQAQGQVFKLGLGLSVIYSFGAMIEIFGFMTPLEQHPHAAHLFMALLARHWQSPNEDSP